MCGGIQWKKKQRALSETLGTRISETAGAISFKFAVWGHIPGRHLCSKSGSNWMRYVRAK